MDYQLDIVEKEDFVVALLGGVRTPETLIAADSKTIAFCKMKDISRFLIDLRGMSWGPRHTRYLRGCRSEPAESKQHPSADAIGHPRSHRECRTNPILRNRCDQPRAQREDLRRRRPRSPVVAGRPLAVGDGLTTAPGRLARLRGAGRREPFHPAAFRCRASAWVSRAGRASSPRS